MTKSLILTQSSTKVIFDMSNINFSQYIYVELYTIPLVNITEDTSLIVRIPNKTDVVYAVDSGTALSRLIISLNIVSAHGIYTR